jgi:predicted ATPase/class 3 adenylate cyclase/DNA-binding CsgD family transcriptional regulator
MYAGAGGRKLIPMRHSGAARPVLEFPGMTVPTGTVTFLLTDIEGSTGRWEADGAAMAEAVRRHYAILDETIARHGGRRPAEQGEGDSVVAVFSRAADAVAAAVDVQRRFSDEPWPAGAALRLRIALHSGDAELRDADNYFGPGIIRAARLRAIAHGGQTVLSRTTHDLVVDRLPDGVTLVDLGPHRLRDLGRPEQVYQLRHPDLPAEFPPLRSVDAWPNNLPVQLTTFIGRTAEIAEVRRLVAGSRLVTLTGSGGCGKSRLALQAAAESVGDHPDGVWWVELAPVADPALVPQAVLAALGLRDATRSPVEHLTGYLAGQRLLLVLDNCEHLLEASAALVHALLAGCPGLTVLATSREPLAVQGEQTWRVPSLSIPEPGEAPAIEGLDDYEATRLFCDRARRARPNFRLTEDVAAAVGVICRRLDGIPLAIELAAARIRALTAVQIAAGLDDRFRLLTGGPRTVTARHQTLLASVAWSHELLSPPERALFRRLSVFAGGFTLDAAEDVAAGDGLDPLAVLDHLAQLVDRSLVVMEERGGQARYRLLETIRQYAADRLVDAGEAPAVRSRHLGFYRRLAEAAEPRVEAADAAVLDGLEAELDNLRAAHQWALATGSESALRLAAPLPLFWYQRGHYREGRQRLREALESAAEGAAILRAQVLWGLGHLAFYEGDFPEAYDFGERSLTCAEQADDDRMRARALGLLSWVETFRNPLSARARLVAAVAFARRAGDQWSLADNLQAMGWTHVVQEDHDSARPFLEECAAVATRLGNPYFLAWNGGAFGQARIRTGDYAGALAALEAGVAASRAVGEPDTLAWDLSWLCEAKVALGDYDGARAAIDDEGLARLQRTGSGPSVVLLWLGAQQAQLPLALGRTGEARAILEATVGFRPVEGGSWSHMTALCALAGLEAGAGNLPAARARAEEGAEIAARLGNDWAVAATRHVLGAVAQAEGDPGRAESLYHEALAVRAERGWRPDVVESLEALAGLAAELESWREAARLLGAAERLRDEMGLRRWPARRPQHDALVAKVRDGAGPEAFDDAWAEGERLPSEDAVAYVRRARGERKRPSTGWASLTPAEQQVVRLAVEGLTNAQIGARLFMSLGTVKTHLGHVFAKLGVSTRAELVAEAVRRGLC